ncbi:MAG: 5-bromo-4-chloroindolyl phosphate hydrolysis family protein, partial [Firmicutes bacterium]|nr:5-bromo-4-chloroindolyl phosphate hydrolysis family protein [Bacillota bacterium]
MDINNLYDAGEDLVEAVNDAVRRNDFSGLSSSIKKTVKDVSETIQRDVRVYNAQSQREDIRRRNYRNTSGQGVPHPYDENPYRRYRSTAGQAYGQRMSGAKPQPQTQRRFRTQKTPFLQKLVSRTSGSGKIFGGIFGMVIGIPMVLSNLAGLIAGGLASGPLFGLLAGAIIAAGSAYAFVTGRKDKELVKRYYQYAQAVGDAEYIEIDKLARKTGRTRQEVLADIKALMDKGLLAEAWLDEQETTLILTEEVYDQYKQIREQSEQLRQQAEKVQEADADLPESARAIIKEGREYIRTIHEYNDEIPGVEMSEKLYRLESTMDRIVEQVRKQPESAPELRKLMSYYLPTTVKLLSAYKELDRQTVSGENIVNTKKEIEDALDTINDAFEKLLDSLFQSMAWDVSSDISVMQTMFAQDGLTEKEMAAESGQSTAQMEKQVYGTTLTWGDGGGAAQAQMQEEQK